MNMSCNEIMKHRQPSPSWYKAAKAIAPFLLFVLLILNALTVTAISSKSYVGNKSTKVYHTSTCTYSEKISSANRVYFSSRSEAEQKGYRRCYYCGDDVIESGQNSGSSNGSSSGIRNPSSSHNSSNELKNDNESAAAKQDTQKNNSHLLFLAVVLCCYVLTSFLFLASAYLCDCLRKNNHRDLADVLNGIPLVLWLLSLPLSEILRRKLEAHLQKRRTTRVSVPDTNNKSQSYVSNDALSHSSAENPQEPVYYMEAANGMLVRVPQSKLEVWQAEQDRQRSDENLELTEQERKLKEDILERIYGTERGHHEEKPNKDTHGPAAPFR